VRDLTEELRDTAVTVLPVALLATILLVLFGETNGSTWTNFVVGCIATVLGLALFLTGVRVALLPTGETLGERMASTGSIVVVMVVTMGAGVLVTLAEPDVRILASQLDNADATLVPRLTYVLVVAAGVGVSLAVAMLRTILDFPLLPLLAVGYAIVGVLAVLTPGDLLAPPFDFGAVTTGPVSVPILLALAAGVVRVLGGGGDVARSFGFIGIASIGPIIAVQVLTLVVA
jgi:hypothetical protein